MSPWALDSGENAADYHLCPPIWPAPAQEYSARGVTAFPIQTQRPPEIPVTRPFRILGLQQIALGAKDKGRLKKLWVDLFGLEIEGVYRSERENVDEDIVALGSGPGKVEVDLMQPLDPDGKIDVSRVALNHIGLWVDDLPLAMEWLEQQGVRFAPGGIRGGASGHDICFVHPKANDAFPIAGEGVLIELVQAPEEVIEALGR